MWEALSECQLQFLPCKIEYGKYDERYRVTWGVRKGEMYKVGGGMDWVGELS